jgi:hypothetical protein
VISVCAQKENVQGSNTLAKITLKVQAVPCLFLKMQYNRYEMCMNQVFSHLRVIEEVRDQSQVSPPGVCGRQSGTGARFSLCTLVYPCQCHSTNDPYSRSFVCRRQCIILPVDSVVKYWEVTGTFLRVVERSGLIRLHDSAQNNGISFLSVRWMKECLLPKCLAEGRHAKLFSLKNPCLRWDRWKFFHLAWSAR